MTIKTAAELRQTFLAFFAREDHRIIPSSPLVPGNDPTLLFTNAGMVQFKETFLGLEVRDYNRAVTSQRCIRAGGKHNDLENVGYTARHHTFFEMLGNFSFGDYFKREAICFAWTFLTEVLALPPEKLWVTVYEEDDEAADIWLKELKVDANRFSRCGSKDNFWMMGNTGPCGPCSEIFYDHGPDIWGGPPGSPEEDGDRYIEIWNLVFMQFERDENSNMTPLPCPSVDTGMGLERLAAVMQGVHNNYEIDLFQNLLCAVADVTGHADTTNNSMRVIADHIRACAFLVVDDVLPSNEGRGYVLRRIIRRAIRHGHKLGMRDLFFHRLVKPLAAEMGTAYPELVKSQDRVQQVLKQEEERFAVTLDQGMNLLEKAIADMSGKTLPGDVAFKLYDTYGFPLDLIADVARERKLSVDTEGFDQAMAAQRKRARAASQFEGQWSKLPELKAKTDFIGYTQLSDNSTVTALFVDDTATEILNAGQSGQVILEKTPFYAESGGQIGDCGVLTNDNTHFVVSNTRKNAQAHVHFGKLLSGSLRVGDVLTAHVDEIARTATARNHSATHLLHAALRNVLGEHVAQKGSLVASERLRFDFSHFEPITAEQLQHIEHMVNEQILQNTLVETRLMALDEAMQSGAMALFGEKYDEQVRVLSMGHFSTELCGGTHVHQLGDIGLFKIVSENGVAAGVRRIEAVTGQQALHWVSDTEIALNSVLSLLKTNRESLGERLEQIMSRLRETEKELERLQGKLASSQGDDLATKAKNINGVKVLSERLDSLDAKQLRSTLDQLKNKLDSAVIVLATVRDNKVSLVAGVTADRTNQLKAGELVNYVAQQVGGKGGGRADMAQAGGSNPAALDEALRSVTDWVDSKL